MKLTLLPVLILFIIQVTFGQDKTTAEALLQKNQEAIIEEFTTNCAYHYNYTYDMAAWQECLDKGLKKDSTIAYLWQQKAMPYFKARKYEIGMGFIDKAVEYDAPRWQSYRAFIKCIFAKTYREAIADFEDCKKKFGNSYVMDHTYDFYIGLCYLQLNEFEKAEKCFKGYVDDLFQKRQGLEHPTALFYYGISKYEQGQWEEAIAEFDKALKISTNFSDAKYYKSVCMAKLNRGGYTDLFDEARQDGLQGYSLSEDNTLYETYPYQIRWK